MSILQGHAAHPGARSLAERVVREFWRLMASNDFDSVANVLTEDFVVEWPLSNERFRGAEVFARLNREYPAHGPWQFTLHRVLASGDQVVTDVAITDGVQRARALSFFTVVGGRIRTLTEFWPEPYEAPANRAHLSEPIE